MRNLLELIRAAKSFSEIYPGLKEWKRSLGNFAFVDFDAMCDFANVQLNQDKPIDLDSYHFFLNAVNLIRQWREKTNEQFKIDFTKKGFQVDFAFPFGAPLEHIVEAENRMFVVCLLAALKGLDEQKLYQEFKYYKKAHERHWTITGLTQTYVWAGCANEQLDLSDELKTKRVGALSYIK